MTYVFACDIVEHSGYFFGNVAYTRYDVGSEMFQTDNTLLHFRCVVISKVI
jgi:hypothetical protein